MTTTLSELTGPDQGRAKRTGVEQAEAQVAHFSSTVIQHTVFDGCISSIKAMHEAARHNRGRARGMLIWGPTGTGKSTIAKVYELQHPREEAADRTLVPVLRIELPGQPTAKALGETILLALRDPLPHAGSAEFRLNRVRKLLKECGVQLLLFDEVQHLTDNLNSRDRNIAADTLKNLMNDTGIPCVFIGTPSCRGYFVENQQLGRRCSPKLGIEPFRFKEVGEQKEFLRLLKSLHDKLPLVGPSALIDRAVAPSLYFASFGLLGILVQLIESALRDTLLSGGTRLEREALRRSFADVIFPRCPRIRNPFDEEFSGLPLVSQGEPFHGFQA